MDPATSPERKRLIAWALSFVQTVQSMPGVVRIALIGSVATAKQRP